VLTCTVLRACVVELEAGEILVNEPIAGDQARWIIDQAKTGPQGANALVVVKPKACDITTNLVLSTDRRIYDLDLDSPACNERSTNPKRSYVRHVRFYYPDADTAAAAPAGDGRPVAQRDRTATPAVNAARSATRATNRDYRIVRKRRGPLGLFGKKPLDFPWQPAAIVDDGAHVYITLPIRALYDAAPVLYALEDDGSRTLVNYAVRANAYVTDRTFRRGVFVLASGGREQRLEFENRAWRKAPATAARDAGDAPPKAEGQR
jgi:type IV secretion system protein VirB9